MHLSRVVVRNFRNFRVLDLDLSSGLTCVLGENNTGKSNLVHALRLAVDASLSSYRRMLAEDDCAVFVADLEGELVGMSCARVDRAPPILLEVERAEITDLGVQRGHRRRGIGRALAEAALAWVRERRVARVEVRVVAGNRGGQAFWLDLGFGDHVQILQRSADE